MPNAHWFDEDNNGYKSFEMPGAKPHYNPDRPGQVEHIALDLSLDLDKQTCEGTCKIRIMPVRDGIDKLTLDAVDQQIESIKVGSTNRSLTTMANSSTSASNSPPKRGKPSL
jgi:aminopeptidase N